MYYETNGRIHNTLPDKLEMGGRLIFNPSWEHFESAGWKILPEGFDRKTWKLSNGEYIQKSQEELDAMSDDAFIVNKSKKLDSIDAKTQSIIDEGFEFDSVIFSLSLSAQQNWTGMQVAVAQGYLPEAAFPFEIATKDNQTYDLSWEMAPSFFQSVLAKISSTLASGRALKKLVNAATTQEELDSIVDNR